MEEDSTLITREWLYTKVELLDQNSRKDLIADVSDPGCESEEVLREAVRAGAGLPPLPHPEKRLPQHPPR